MKIRILCVLFSVITLVLCACDGKSESGSQASASPDSASKASPDTPITTVEPTTEHYLDQSEAAAHKVELLVTKPLKSKSKCLTCSPNLLFKHSYLLFLFPPFP